MAAGTHVSCTTPPSTCTPLLPADDVEVISVRQVARRTLSANVTATLGVDIPAGATGGLAAVAGGDLLSSDPDRFFGRTTKVAFFYWPWH